LVVTSSVASILDQRGKKIGQQIGTDNVEPHSTVVAEMGRSSLEVVEGGMAAS